MPAAASARRATRLPQPERAQAQHRRGAQQQRARPRDARRRAGEPCAHAQPQARVEFVEPLRVLPQARARVRAREAACAKAASVPQRLQATAHRVAPRRSAPANERSNSARSGTTRSAAPDGVGARSSATKSAIVKSISWPMPLMIGIGQAKIARATASSLNASRSSSEPPPRARISTSQSAAQRGEAQRRDDFDGAAATLDRHRVDQHRHGRETAPQDVQDVAECGAGRRGDHADASRQARQGLAVRRVEQALDRSFCFSSSKRLRSAPSPGLLEVLDDHLELATRLVETHAPAGDDLRAVRDREAHQLVAAAEHAQRTWAARP